MIEIVLPMKVKYITTVILNRNIFRFSKRLDTINDVFFVIFRKLKTVYRDKPITMNTNQIGHCVATVNVSGVPTPIKELFASSTVLNFSEFTGNEKFG